MFKKLTILVVGALLCLDFGVFAQSGKVDVPIAPLAIGDRVPPSFWKVQHSVLSRGKVAAADLSSYSGKLLVIDFWGTFCSPCIANFPVLDSIAGRVGEGMAVLAVTRETSAVVSAFTAKDGGTISLPKSTVVGDVSLSRYFPHNGIPHYVVISPSGEVVAVTDISQLTVENLMGWMRGGRVAVAQKRDQDLSRPLFLSSDVSDMKSLGAHSVFIKGWYNGMPSGSHLRTSADSVLSFSVTNLQLLRIYIAAVDRLQAQRGQRFSTKTMVIRVPNTTWLKPIDSVGGVYAKRNQYSYGIAVPGALKDSVYSFMLNDLNRYSGYHGSIQRRRVTCLVLQVLDRSKLIASAGGKPVSPVFGGNGGARAVMRNQPLSILVMRLNGNSFLKQLIVDETGFTGKLDLEFSPLRSLSGLQAELQHYGMRLVAAERDMDVFVLSVGDATSTLNRTR